MQFLHRLHLNDYYQQREEGESELNQHSKKARMNKTVSK